MMQYYGRQTCLNGHVICHYLGSSFETRQPFCNECGAATITDCPACKAAQRGVPVDSMGIPGKHPDAYCWKCGEAYPWTEQNLNAAREMIREEEQLSDDDKSKLIESIPDLMLDTPRANLAASRFTRIVGKASAGFKSAMYKFVIDWSSETAKKIIMGE